MARVASSSRGRLHLDAAPVQGEQLAEAVLRRVGDAGEDVGEPSLRVDVVELGGAYEAVDDGGSLGATVRSGEEPGLAAEGQPSQASFRGIVRQAYAAVAEEAGEAIPSPEHVVHGLGDGRMPREPGAMLAYPGFEIGDEQSAALPADGEALPGRDAVDLALDVEERVDTGNRLEGDRRDRCSFAATPSIGGDVGEYEELAPCVSPAQGLDDRPRLAVGREQPVVAGIGVSLQDAIEAAQMLFWMIARAVSRSPEQHGRRIDAAERPVVTDIDPGPAGVGPALRQGSADRHHSALRHKASLAGGVRINKPGSRSKPQPDSAYPQGRTPTNCLGS